MNYPAHGRKDRDGGWEDLDALVIEEMDALNGRQRERRPEPAPKSPQPKSRREAPFREAPLREADAFHEPPEGDEEAFIERTVDYLRDRPDAEALLEAIHATLFDEEPLSADDEPEGPPQAAREAPSRPAPDQEDEAPPEGSA
jgi:hypothetical protein